MKYELLYTDAAKKETEDAAIYYEEISHGLGLSFLDEIEIKFGIIRKNPFTYGYIDDQKQLRDVKINRFPFVVIYKIESERVIVISVHHTRKEPFH